MLVQFSPYNNKPAFQAHGARNLRQVMNRLYKSAYSNELYEHKPDIIQISSKMSDGIDITGVAYFENGQYKGLSFPYEHAHYRREFCQKIFDKYNQSITKGKYSKK